MYIAMALSPKSTSRAKAIVPVSLDVSASRYARNYTLLEMAWRIVWSACGPAFRLSPRLFWGWRNSLLRGFGAKIGRGVRVDPSVKVFAPWNLSIGADTSIGYDAVLYNLGEIVIGSRVTISQRAHLCAGTHDYSDAQMPLRKLPITVGDEVWVCADVFVGPNVHIGSQAVLGARAVVVRDVPAGAVVAGNPAQFIKSRVIK